MKFKRTTIILILLCFAISLSTVSASENVSMDNLNVVDDEVLEVSDRIETIDDLNSKIQNATANSTVKLENDLIADENVKSEGIIISERLILDGQGHKIDGNSSDIHFFFGIHADNVVLKNIVFTNWDMTDSYNLIEWVGSNGEMSNCTFIDNYAMYGGAVDWTGVNGFLNNCTFINNTAENGGAVYWYGIGGDIANCIFFNNTAEIGGATYITGRDTRLINCKFRNNSADDLGGAVFSEGLNFVISKCDFTNNTATNGGAVYSEAYPNLIDTCNFTDNNANETAGALYLASDNNTVKNSIFTNNTASDGGAIYSDANDELYVLNSKFNYNSVQGFGGAIMADDYVNIANSTFNSNNAITGGAVYSESTTDISNSTFSNNKAINGGAITVNDGEIVNSTFTKNFANDTGGAIYVSGNLNLDKIYFNNNTAVNGSNNIYSDDAQIIMAMNMTISMTNITFGDTLKVKVTMPKNIITGTITVYVNGKAYKTNLTSNQATVNIAKLNSGSYEVQVLYEGSEYNSTTFDYEVDVSRKPVVISAVKKSFIINYAGKYSIKIKDEKGKVIAGQKVSVYINNKLIKTATTNKKGIATIKISASKLKSLKAGTKTLKVKISNNFKPNSKSVKITIKKEKTKIVAKQKTFKKSLKTKKYVVKFKNSKNKALKKAKVYLKVNGKTYKAKTTSKGNALFKITKLNKKGKFTAKITFKTNKYYKGVSKKVKLTIK